jgi:glycosyltransferase involved in cell wall biosynthesis
MKPLAGADDVTVVVPTRGCSPFLGEALSSAVAQGPAEVILVEDGPCGIDESLFPPGVRVVRVAAAGRSAARNSGVRAASTPFVAFLDDDDVMLPEGIVRLRDRLVASPRAALAFGPVRVIDGAGEPMIEWNELLAPRFEQLASSRCAAVDVLATRCPIYTSATLVRPAAVLAAGGYDPGLDAHEDLDLYLRLAPLAACTGVPVTAYRLHGANTPSDDLYRSLLAVAAKHLPSASRRERRLLVEWRADALWGLGLMAQLRRESVRSILRDPALLTRPQFVKRLVGSYLRRTGVG